MKTLFGLHYVKNQKNPIEQATTYFTLFEKRHSSDYDDFILILILIARWWKN
jgi:hypothetical protein